MFSDRYLYPLAVLRNNFTDLWLQIPSIDYPRNYAIFLPTFHLLSIP